MSDFLTRLAARQLGQIETIEPRIKPVYAEPANPSPVNSIIEDISWVPPPRQDEIVRAPQTSEPRTPRFASPQAVYGAADSTRTAEPHRGEDHADLYGRIKEFTSEPLTRDSERIQRTNEDAWDVPAIAAKVSAVQSPTNIQLFAAPTPESSDSSRTVKPLLVTSDKIKPVAPPSLEDSTSARLARRQVKLAAPDSLSTRKDRLDELAAKPIAQAPVQVTIGRIEVTALTQAAPAKRAAAPRKPAMSLDEYLARRQRRES